MTRNFKPIGEGVDDGCQARGAAVALGCWRCRWRAAEAQRYGRTRRHRSRATACRANRCELTSRAGRSAPQPLAFTIDNPARISLDLPDTRIALGSRRIDVKAGGRRQYRRRRGGRPHAGRAQPRRRWCRTRRFVGNDSIRDRDASGTGEAAMRSVATGRTGDVANRRSAGVGPDAAISNIDFRRGTDGAGQVIVRSPTRTRVAEPAPGRRPDRRRLRRREPAREPGAPLDVADFATPVTRSTRCASATAPAWSSLPPATSSSSPISPTTCT